MPLISFVNYPEAIRHSAAAIRLLRDEGANLAMKQLRPNKKGLLLTNDGVTFSASQPDPT